MEDEIPKKIKLKCWELVNPIILMECLEKDDLESSKYIDYMCHITPDYSTWGRYVIKILRLDSGTPEEWIIFVDLVQMALVQQNAATDPLMYKCIEQSLKSDAESRVYSAG